MIVIQPYDPAWPSEFERLRADLQTALGPLAVRIDHIGSTSVPGLAAKDVIDIQVTVRALTPTLRRRMLAAGYQYFEAITHDHTPPGADPNPRLWNKMFFNQPAGERRANIHIRALGKPNQAYPLLFRDYLRAHPRSAAAVEIIKRQLARHHADDIEAYYDIKDPVYDLIWDAALEWAQSARRE